MTDRIVPRRRPRLRRLAMATLAGIAVVATVTAVVLHRSGRGGGVARIGPAKLTADMRAASGTGYSGTVFTRVGVDIPRDLRAAVASLGSTPAPAVLLTGSHTLRFWYGGATRQRIELVRSDSEYDLFRTGTDVWQWDSRARVAVHTTLADTRIPWPLSLSTPSTLTPSALARRMLSMLGTQTAATVRPGPKVADRATYQLDLTPRDTQSRVSAVHVEVDAGTGVALGVQIYARGRTSPSVAVAFTSVVMSQPDAQDFVFMPPDHATVRDVRLPDVGPSAGPSAGRNSVRTARHAAFAELQLVPTTRPTTVAGPGPTGSGWQAVATYATTPAVARRATAGSAWTAVSGAWGRGRLDQTPLVDTLVTDAGQVYVGAVQPAVLYSAAAGGR